VSTVEPCGPPRMSGSCEAIVPGDVHDSTFAKASPSIQSCQEAIDVNWQSLEF
jgi:hypothetical protein